MKKNEVRERDWRNLNTRYARQWDVQGSAVDPYVVSQRSDGIFECSCPAWKTTKGRLGQREDCKHVLRVQLAYASAAPAATTTTTAPTHSSINIDIKGRKFR